MSSYTSFAKKPRRARRHWGANWRRTRTSVSASPSNRAGSVPLQVTFAAGQNWSKFAPDSLLSPTRVRPPPAATRFFADSALEGDGFEPSVPRERNSLVGSIPGTLRGIEGDHYEALIGEAWFAVPYKSAASGIPLSRLQEP